MATSTPTTKRKDPLPVFCFMVKIDCLGLPEDLQGFFKSVSGLKFETEIVPVSAGGANDTTFQLPGTTKWGNLVFKQGFMSSSALFGWRQKWLKGDMERSDGTITLLNTALKATAEWKFTHGWPCKWEIGEFDASKSELAVETLEIAHEGLTFSPA
jgi:phage tail-like protein